MWTIAIALYIWICGYQDITEIKITFQKHKTFYYFKFAPAYRQIPLKIEMEKRFITKAVESLQHLPEVRQFYTLTFYENVYK